MVSSSLGFSRHLSRPRKKRFLNILHLALINRAGGRSVWENLDRGRKYRPNAHDRGQDSPIQTDLARVIRCLLSGKNKNNLIRFM